MALTLADLDALDTAIASGELRVTLDGRSVEYRSIDDLLKARRHVAAALSAASGSASQSTGPRVRRATFGD